MEPIGEGGMGVVYSAEQSEPFRRQVALKLLKPGMDSRRILQRFELEKQVLQQMEHPGITRILDAGTQPNGRPFFAMELVESARTITEYVSDEKLDLAERVRLLAEVCDIVEHAHQRGVIHRDLKPSNILITEHDGKAVPKVIDFGIAKVTGSDGDPNEQTTKPHECMGTLMYMSPEHSPWNCEVVDTRSDVFSLGVLLFELLAGEPPQINLSGEPGTTPSLRLGDHVQALSPAELAELAKSCGSNASLLRKTLSRELDWICTKARAEEKDERYQSVAELQKDLNRFLSDLPVEAAKPSMIYRGKKFIKRHRTFAGIVGCLAATVCCVAFVASCFAYRATVAESVALRRLDETMAIYDELLEQRKQADSEKRRALAYIHQRAADEATLAAALEYERTLVATVSAGEDPSGLSPASCLNFDYLNAPHKSLAIKGNFRWLKRSAILDHRFETDARFSSDEIAELTAWRRSQRGGKANAVVETTRTPSVKSPGYYKLRFQQLVLEEMRKQLPENDPLLAEILDNCAAIALESNQPELAARLLEDAVAIWQFDDAFPARCIQSRLLLAKALRSNNASAMAADAIETQALSELDSADVKPSDRDALLSLAKRLRLSFESDPLIP